MGRIKELTSRYLYLFLALAGAVSGVICAMLLPKTAVSGQILLVATDRLLPSILIWSVIQFLFCLLLYSSFLKIPFLCCMFAGYGFGLFYFCTVFLHLNGLPGFFAALFCMLPRYLVLPYLFLSEEKKEQGIRNRETLLRLRIKMGIFGAALLFLTVLMETYINQYIVRFFSALS